MVRVPVKLDVFVTIHDDKICFFDANEGLIWGQISLNHIEHREVQLRKDNLLIREGEACQQAKREFRCNPESAKCIILNDLRALTIPEMVKHTIAEAVARSEVISEATEDIFRYAKKAVEDQTTAERLAYLLSSSNPNND